MDEIKDLLKSRRLELGYTMKDLAEKLGVSEATVSRWESGEIQNMRRNNIVTLSKLLQIPPNLIMGWDISVDISNSGTISNIGHEDNSTFNSSNSNNTANYFCEKSCDFDLAKESKESTVRYYTDNNKNYFLAIVDNIRSMNDEQLADVLKYTEFVLSKI